MSEDLIKETKEDILKAISKNTEMSISGIVGIGNEYKIVERLTKKLSEENKNADTNVQRPEKGWQLSGR